MKLEKTIGKNPDAKIPILTIKISFWNYFWMNSTLYAVYVRVNLNEATVSFNDLFTCDYRQPTNKNQRWRQRYTNQLRDIRQLFDDLSSSLKMTPPSETQTRRAMTSILVLFATQIYRLCNFIVAVGLPPCAELQEFRFIFWFFFFSAGRICMCRNNWTQMNGLHWLHGRIELMRLWQLRTIEWKTWFIGKFPPFVHWPIDEFSIDLKWELKFGKIDCINWCHEKFFQSIKSQIFFAIKVW